MLAQADRDQVGAESGATSTPAWLAHETRTGPAARHADLHLATKLDQAFHVTRAALAGGGIDVGEGPDRHPRGGDVDDRVRRPPGRDACQGRGPHGRPRPAVRRAHAQTARQTTLRGRLPRSGRRRRRQAARQGRSQGTGPGVLLHPRQRRRHQRGPVQAPHPARPPAQESPRSVDVAAADRRRAPRPRDREEAPALHAARPRADGAAGEPPVGPAERERVPVHPRGHRPPPRPDQRPRDRGHRHRPPALRRRAPPAGLQSRHHPDGPRRRLDAAGPRPRTTAVRPLPEARHQLPLRRPLRRHQLRPPAAWLEYHHEEPWALKAGQQTPRRASPSAHPTTTWPTTQNPGT